MSALFSKPKVDKSAQEAQLAEQKRQSDRIREQEQETNLETGARNRVLNARLQTRGVPTLLNTAAATGNTLGG